MKNEMNVDSKSGTSVPDTQKGIKMAARLGIVAFAVLFSVSSFLPETAAEGGSRPAAYASGAELFANNCARCHGPDGKGGKGPNLASEKRQAKWRQSDEKLIKKITNGGLFMPSFGKKLKAEEIQAIADHVRTLKE